MRNLINDKFKGISHKWITFPLDSKEFKHILLEIKDNIKSKNVKLTEAQNLIKNFKDYGECWIKFKSVKGRSNVQCLCQIITENNTQLNIVLSGESVLESSILNGTPKSLRLFSSKNRIPGKWKKPKDDFVDPIKYPPAEEELTEYGYEIYVAWQKEKLGLTNK